MEAHLALDVHPRLVRERVPDRHRARAAPAQVRLLVHLEPDA